MAIDDVSGALIAVEHIMRTRDPKVALVNGDVSNAKFAHLREGARRAVSAWGGNLTEYDALNVSTEAGRQIGFDIAERVPDGIFCVDGPLAQGFIRGLAERGVLVPHRVSVVGYGNHAFDADPTLMSLKTVNQPSSNMAVLASESLIAEIENIDEHEHRVIVLPPTLIVRGSAPPFRRDA